MTFDKVVSHLGKRGYVTREKWNGISVYFGLDNLFMEVNSINGTNNRYFFMCLDDIVADDWIIVNSFWEGYNDRITGT